MEKLNSVSHSAQEVGGTTGGIINGDDAQNKKLPGVMEEGLMTKESAPQARKTELDEIWKMVMKLRASTRGHDNVHDNMNMYVIMHDQCLFIAMINSFHT